MFFKKKKRKKRKKRNEESVVPLRESLQGTPPNKSSGSLRGNKDQDSAREYEIVGHTKKGQKPPKRDMIASE